MPIRLPPLPYDRNALEPVISARTLDYHHGKHHKSYVDKTNAAIEGTRLADASHEEIVRAASQDKNQSLFNNSAQAWNHAFLWESMSPDGGDAPEGRLANAIQRAFGGVEGFGKAFRDAATGHFGSGWTWLCAKGDDLVILATHDADTPLVHDGLAPLMTLDLWEHAYYLDYQNARADYVDAFLKNAINWSFAATNYR